MYHFATAVSEGRRHFVNSHAYGSVYNFSSVHSRHVSDILNTITVALQRTRVLLFT